MWKGFGQIASKYTSAFLNPLAADVLKSSASGFRFCNVHKMCLTSGETKTVLKTEIFQSYIEIWKVSDKCQTLWQLSGMLHEHHFVVSRTEMCVIHILTVWGLMIAFVFWNIGHQWFRSWLVTYSMASPHQTNTDLLMKEPLQTTLCVLSINAFKLLYANMSDDKA